LSVLCAFFVPPLTMSSRHGDGVHAADGHLLGGVVWWIPGRNRCPPRLVTAATLSLPSWRGAVCHGASLIKRAGLNRSVLLHPQLAQRFFLNKSILYTMSHLELYLSKLPSAGKGLVIREILMNDQSNCCSSTKTVLSRASADRQRQQEPEREHRLARIASTRC
jgi:hypothetical protein